jgi:uncharacterized protein YkwD
MGCLLIFLTIAQTPADLLTHKANDKEKKAGPIKLTRTEQEIIDLTNKERAKEGLSLLKVNERLMKAAREHSKNMAKQDKLAHELDGKGPADRLRKSGYRWSTWGENVAMGQRTAAEALKTWIASEPHRKNILNKAYTEIGTGVAPSPQGAPYYTQVFGTPRSR